MRSPLVMPLFWIAFVGLAGLGLYGISNDQALGWIPLIISGFLLGAYCGSGPGDVFGAKRGSPADVAERAKAAGLSKDEMRALDAEIDREQNITIALVDAFSPPSGLDEPLPPWIKYPGWSPYHVFWRMGAGESYLLQPFGPFMASLDKSERKHYFARYDLGAKWPHREHWYQAWVETDY